MKTWTWVLTGGIMKQTKLTGISAWCNGFNLIQRECRRNGNGAPREKFEVFSSILVEQEGNE